MDSHETPTKDDRATDWEGRLREPLEAAQAKARAKLRGVGELIGRHPGASLAIAFVIGFGIARALQRAS